MLTDGRRVRVLRVIARLNMGGPAHHVSLLSGLLDRARYETLLLHGNVGPGEASLGDVARRHQATLEEVPALGPQLRPPDDLRALLALVRTIRAFRPDIVHTHTAKAGVLGRVAAVLAGQPRPVIVHTYHGHVLEGYFGPTQNRLYRAIERRLARVSDCLIGVSAATVEDLVRLRIAPREKFRVIPIGLDLDHFLRPEPDARTEFRRNLGVRHDEILLTFVGRLVPIKRVDLTLRAVARARERGAPIRLAVVGDGELRGTLEHLNGQLRLDGAVSFLGYRSDVAAVAAAADVAILTSDNEGTPVSLIEAAAAGRPAVATDVGGVAEVVTAETGFLVGPGDVEGLAGAICRLAGDASGRERMGRLAREHVFDRFSSARLVRDIDRLYRDLLGRRSADANGLGSLPPRAGEDLPGLAYVPSEHRYVEKPLR